MTSLRAIWSVFEFEFRRTLTWQRLAFVVVLSLLPVIMVSVVQYQGAHLERNMHGEIALFILIPEVVCLMGLLFWATPAIHWELEGKTWSYLSVRPAGRSAILLGKYFAAVAWAVLCGWLSLLLCLAALAGDLAIGRALTTLGPLIAISCLVYGALYIFLSVMFLQRAMVAAVAYTALMEVVIAWIPATINQFSMHYHLRCVMAQWIGFDPGRVGEGAVLIFTSSWAPWQHLLTLSALALVLLTAAIAVLLQRQLVVAGDS